MIFKDSILDAYTTLYGSAQQHIAMLITFILVVREMPEQIIVYEELGEKCQVVYILSIVTHVTCAAYDLLKTIDRVSRSKFNHVVETLLVFLNIYLMLYCLEVFAEINKENIKNSDIFDPSV